MEFFTTFWIQLDELLEQYISVNTARAAVALTPAISFFGMLYIMIWGYLHMIGKVDEPFSTGLKRILTLAIVFALSLHTWLYNDLIVDTFYNAPAQLASAVVGAADPIAMIDVIWVRAATMAENLADRATLMSGLDYFFMPYIIRFIVGVLCVYTMFLIALSKVALAILLALGPLFIVMLLFDATRQYFNAWIAQLSNYALITILTIMVCALLLGLVQKYANDTAGVAALIHVADVFDFLLASALAFLFMLQVPNVAATLAAGGSVLNTFGTERWAHAKARNAAKLSRDYGLALGVGIYGRARRAVSWVYGRLKPRNFADPSGASPETTQTGRVSRNSIEPSRHNSK